MTARLWRRQVTAGALLLSAPINAVGVAALIGMFTAFALDARSTGMTLGRTNDILGLVGAVLMLPAVVEIHALTGPDRRALRVLVAVIGAGGLSAIVLLQSLLVSERVTFEQQLPWVTVAYAAIAIWFVIGGWTASTRGVMPNGGRLGAAAALYVGQPWWAWRWAQRLLALAADPAVHPAGGGVEGDPVPAPVPVAE